MRIVSLVPGATEILFALGLGDQVVGVSHECDFPPAVLRLPRLTAGQFDPDLLAAAEIDASVSQSLAQGRPLYRVDVGALRQLRPDVVITQDLCTVCAVEGGQVREAAALLDPRPQVLSVGPGSLEEVFSAIEFLGGRGGAGDRARALIADLRARVERVQAAVAGAIRPRVLCLEWLDPPWIAGHWVPELVALAGGRDALGQAGAPSRRATWAEVAATQADVVILMPCGFDLQRAVRDAAGLRQQPAFAGLPGVRARRAYAVDASAYFSRAGPRLVDGLEILAALLHPDRFGGRPDPASARPLRWP